MVFYQLAYNAKPNVISRDQLDPIQVHSQVKATGKYNYEEAKIQLPSNINLTYWINLVKIIGTTNFHNFLNLVFR